VLAKPTRVPCWISSGSVASAARGRPLLGLARTIYTVHIRCFWQGDHHIYGHIRCIYTVLANPIYMRCIYGTSGREITIYTVIYVADIQFWPTLSLAHWLQHPFDYL